MRCGVHFFQYSAEFSAGAAHCHRGMVTPPTMSKARKSQSHSRCGRCEGVIDMVARSLGGQVGRRADPPIVGGGSRLIKRRWEFRRNAPPGLAETHTAGTRKLAPATSCASARRSVIGADGPVVDQERSAIPAVGVE